MQDYLAHKELAVRYRGPLAALVAALTVCSAPSPGAGVPRVQSGQVKTPLNHRTIGFVDLYVDGKRNRIVEILTSVGGLTVGQRADRIAGRVRDLIKLRPEWWRSVGAGRVRGQFVVQVRGGDGLLVTADPGFARENLCTPPVLARRIAAQIRGAYGQKVDWLQVAGLPQSGRRSVQALSVAARAESDRAEAARLRQDGDLALVSGVIDSEETAESKYHVALDRAPNYVAPMLRLAELYLKQGKAQEAEQMLLRAARVPDLSAEEKVEIAALRAKLDR